MGSYVGRFAPSPTGPLHAGSLVAALASWLDARAAPAGKGGRWLVRIEDVDPPRCPTGAAALILAQLAACGLRPDEAPLYQSTRGARYQEALGQLLARGLAYPCACTRRDIEAAQAARGQAHERHAPPPYPGTCRAGLCGRPARAWRFHCEAFQARGLPRDAALLPCPQERAPSAPPRSAPSVKNKSNIDQTITQQAQQASFLIATDGLHWHDRRLGWQRQDVAASVGDFVLRRADGLWAYQLAVVVDDADQGITHVVRGEDLADNTPRQILLQQALGQPTPRYLHTPLVRAADGEKLSKQHGAPAIDHRQPLAALAAAAQQLGLPPAPAHAGLGDALAYWVAAWAGIYNLAP